MNAPDADRFANLEALDREHGELLEALDQACANEAVASDSASERSFVEANRERILHFLSKGAATGAVLHGLAERRPAQQILDRWAACLFRVGVRDAPVATLAPFDEAAAPDLRDKPCPYVGLEPFHEGQAPRFFGRDQRTADLTDAVRAQAFVFVTGASGSGKSSLVLAGLLPALKARDGRIEGSDRWTFLPPIVPGTNPLQSLTHALCATFGGLDEAQVLDELRADPARLRTLLDEHAPTTCLIVVDQFEEVFTLRSTDAAGDSAAFVAALIALAQWPDCRHRIVATFRKDREGDLAASGALQHFYFERPFIVSSMLPDELRGAIEGPAAQVGLIVEPDVVDALVHTFTGDETGLPLLQYCLVELWERRTRNRVTRRTLAELGDPKHAMAKVADEVYSALLVEGQAAARLVFLRLSRKVEGQEFLRVRQLRKDLWSAVGNKLTVDDVIGRFAERRLLRVSPAGSGDPAEDTIEVAHEALLRNWTEFRKWVVEAGARLDQRMFVSRQAALWSESEGRAAGAREQDATGLLLSGIALRQAMEDLYADFPAQSVERRFLDASSRKAQWVESELQRAADAARLEAAWAMATARRKSRLIQVVVAGAATVLTILLAAMTYKELVDARDRQALLAQRLGSQALQVCETDARQARRLARLAFGIAAPAQPAWRIRWPEPPGAAALADAIAATHCLIRSPSAIDLVTTTIPEGDAGAVFAIAADGRRLVTGDKQGALAEWSIEESAARMTDSAKVFGEARLPVSALAYSPDGNHLLVGAGGLGVEGGGYCAPGSLCGAVALLAREASGTMRIVARMDGRAVTHVAFSRDGSHLAVASLVAGPGWTGPGEAGVEWIVELWDRAAVERQGTLDIPRTSRTIDAGVHELAAASDVGAFLAVTRANTVLPIRAGRVPRASAPARLRQCPVAPLSSAAGVREIRAEAARLCVFALRSDSLLMTLEAPNVVEATLRGNGNLLVTAAAGADGGADVAVRDLEAGTPPVVIRRAIEAQALEDCGASGTSVASLACTDLAKLVQVSTDGATIAVRPTAEGPIHVHRVVPARNRPTWLSQRANNVVFSRSDEVFGVLGPAGTTTAERGLAYRVHDAATGRLVREVGLPALDASSRLRMINAAGDRFLTQEAGATAWRIDERGTSVEAAIGPDLAVDVYPAAEAFSVTQRDAATGQGVFCALQHLDAPVAPAWSTSEAFDACLFSADGKVALVETTRNGTRTLTLHDTGRPPSATAAHVDGLAADAQYFLSGTDIKHLLVATPGPIAATDSRIEVYGWRDGQLAKIGEYTGPTPVPGADAGGFAVNAARRTVLVAEGSDRVLLRGLDKSREPEALPAATGSRVVIAPDARTAMALHGSRLTVFDLAKLAPVAEVPFPVRGASYSVGGSHVVVATAQGSQVLPLRVPRLAELLAIGEEPVQLDVHERCKFAHDEEACAQARATGSR
ncbi:MAG TPA: AAA family ATPase [Casimicrobiaceae bacterium]|nr:AAA family ATPase [Casimicrobiaceae bacterium]